MSRTILLLSILIQLTSCLHLKTFKVEMMEPAANEVPAEIKKILIIDRNPIIESYKHENYLFNPKDKNDSIHALRHTTQNFVRKVAEILNNAGRFEVKAISDTSFSEIYSFNWPYIDSLCAKKKVDFLLSLDNFTVNLLLQAKKNDALGYEVLKIQTKATAFCRAYYPAKKAIIAETLAEDSTISDYYESPETEYDINVLLPLSDKLAKQNAEFWSPVWEETTRAYFAGDKKMRKANRYARKKDWRKAASEWKQFVNDKDQLRAGISCFNMAVACEMEGFTEEALRWAEKSDTLLGSKESQIYLYILKTRIDKLNLIKKQLKQ
jgi:hypothetical protein